MTAEPVIPLDPRQRRAILAVPTAVRRLLDSDADSRALLFRNDLAVVDASRSSRELGLTVAGGDLMPHRLYLQSPFRSERYFEASEAHPGFAIERQQLFFQLCQHLGASRVRVLQVERVSGSSGATYGASVGVKGVTPSASASTDVDHELTRRLTIDRFYKGRAPDFDAARALLTSSGLEGDLHFQELVDAREHPNSLRQFDFEYSVTESSRSVLKLAAGLKFPALLKVDVSYQQRLREASELHVKMHLTFGS